jgi:DNA repair exonuclease SbcCD ATPase subunit
MCKKSIEDDLILHKSIALSLSKEIGILHKRNGDIQKLISDEDIKSSKIAFNNNLILRLKSDMENKKSLYSEYRNFVSSKKEALNSLNSELASIEVKLNEMNVEEVSKLKSTINKLDNQYKEIDLFIKTTNNEMVSLSNAKAILLHKQEQHKENIKTLNALLKTKSDLEKSIMINEKVIQGFGSSGIPALIIHNILDDLQADTNMFLSELRPGMQVLFSIVKDRDDGQQEDTLKIDFMLNGIDLEYEQLSGAQKIIAALSLKLGLLSIIKKRFGVDIKLLMIDEVDQSLDDGSLESFEFAIKKLQKDYKVLIITHNKELKSKFGQYILVEQNEKLISTARVVNAW